MDLRYLALFSAILRYLSIFFFFFAVLRYSEPPNVPLNDVYMISPESFFYKFVTKHQPTVMRIFELNIRAAIQ